MLFFYDDSVTSLRTLQQKEKKGIFFSHWIILLEKFDTKYKWITRKVQCVHCGTYDDCYSLRNKHVLLQKANLWSLRSPK